MKNHRTHFPFLKNSFRASSLLAACFAVAPLTTIFAADSAASPKTTSPIKHVFVIAFENHNWTQPASDKSAPPQIFQNPNAPFINSLVTPGNPNASEVSYAVAYHNVLSTPTGKGAKHVHPSETNYIWSEAGTNFNVWNDASPFTKNKDGGVNSQATTQHLSSLLAKSGFTWKSYQEDIDISTHGNVLPKNRWISPIKTIHGKLVGAKNIYNDSDEIFYAPKHNPMIFFSDTNGGNDPTPANKAAVNYAPLQQLEIDLKNNTVANYNWITPDMYNDMHYGLPHGYKGLKGDSAGIRQGDDFLAKVVPMIQASQAYKDGGVIVIWFDETEEKNCDDFAHTIPEIIISQFAKGNAYASRLNLSHSSDLKTWQTVFGLHPFLGDAANGDVQDLSDLFKPGVISTTANP